MVYKKSLQKFIIIIIIKIGPRHQYNHAFFYRLDAVAAKQTVI